MALVRILVDGYSLLHTWLAVAPGKARHSAAARDELVRRLTLYRDAIGTPITIVFDGGGAPPEAPAPLSNPELEVVYSKAGKTADEVIERVTARMRHFGEVLAVTDDYAERDTVIALGGMTSSCANFIEEVETAINDQSGAILQHNRRERARFKTPH